MKHLRTGTIAAFLVLALAAGVTGYLVAQRLSPARVLTGVSVVSLPATPTPSPSPSPTPKPTTKVTINGRSGEGRSCPAGCTCEFPPGGAIYRCGGN